MWTCNPPMHFSVHIIAHILQKQLVWPRANSSFFRTWKQRIVCEPCRARDSTTPGDKTRTCSLFRAVISFNLAAAFSLDHRDLQCYYFISIRSDYFSGQERVFFPGMKCLCRTLTFKTGLVIATQHKRYCRKLQIQVFEWATAQQQMEQEKRKEREEHCSTWARLYLSGTPLSAWLLLAGVSRLPAVLAILQYADMTYCRRTQRCTASTCAASIYLSVNVGKWTSWDDIIPQYLKALPGQYKHQPPHECEGISSH